MTPTEPTPPPEGGAPAPSPTPRRGLWIGLAVGVVILALAVAVAIAVSDDDDGSGDAESAQQWAGSVCTAVDGWLTDVQGTVEDLPSADSFDAALDDFTQGVDEATQDLLDELDRLGPPDTENAQKARQEIETLSDTVGDAVDSIREELDGLEGASARELVGGIAQIVSEVTTTIDDVQTSVDELAQLDPGGELQAAFDAAPACQELVGSGD